MKNISRWFKKYFIPHEGNEFKPHFLRHESMVFFLLIVLVFEIGFLVQTFVVFDKTKFLATVLPGVLTNLTNEERAQNDAPPLVENELLDKAAQAKAEDMATNGYFAHTSPEGKTPWYWFEQVGYNYVYAGENLAVNFFESEDVAKAWMNSPTHRANIVKKDYTEIGIGVASGVYEGRTTVFVAQLFGTPLAIAAPAENETTTETPVTETPKPTPAKPPVKTPTQPVVPVVTPTPTPTPAPVTVTPTPITTPAPTAIKVLGEESATSSPIVSKPSLVKSFIDRVMSSPRTSITYVYKLMSLIVFLALVMLFVRSEKRHVPMVARGFAMIAIIFALTLINIRIFNLKTEVPLDDHNFSANVLEALPQ